MIRIKTRPSDSAARIFQYVTTIEDSKWINPDLIPVEIPPGKMRLLVVRAVIPGIRQPHAAEFDWRFADLYALIST
ncbi:hypothetical protein A6X21_13720 [Planctopirus hydrillae]|uniref:Uncharacterized protein n=1 Tax=Planctopirus hydrillae TaxID=1841610 RepID=A0A1C3E3Y8_9PLAN|nr:hypothetical protein A6X21_13720 [Planctopirus hydrillae]